MNKKLLWLYVLSAAIYATQGFEGLPNLSFFFFLKEQLHLDPAKIMYISSIATIPWLIKPFEGFFIDNYLSKKQWILLSLIGSIIISLWFGLNSLILIPLIITMLMLGNFNAAIRDIANDGLACIEGKKSNTCDIFQNVQWTAITIAGILVSLMGGYLADHYSYKISYLCLIPIYLIIIGIVLKYRTTASKKRKPVHILETICSYKELFVSRPFLLACLFIFLYNFNPSFGTPLLFIKRDTFGWSGTFLGILEAITSVVSLLGAFVYWKYSKKINIEKCLFLSVFIGALTTLCYLYFTPITAIIYGIIFSAVGMFIFLNIMTFMAKSTLPGKEAVSFALLCAINNLAGTASTISGAFLFPKIGLQWLIVASALTSFACLPLISNLKVGDNQ